MSAPARLRDWRPDESLVDHARISPIRFETLCHADRVWVVAGLCAAGFTGEAVAAQLRCSVRTVRNIRATDAFTIAVYALRAREDWLDTTDTHEKRIRDLERTAAGLRSELTRSRNERRKLIDTINRLRRER